MVGSHSDYGYNEAVYDGSQTLAKDMGNVKVVTADIRQAVAEAMQKYDLVLLDVDNGPGHLVHDANAAVYQTPFLQGVHDLLRPGGAVVVWSSAEAPELEKAMGSVFGEATAVPFGVELQGQAEEYWLYLARCDAAPMGTV